ncbi:MAG: hypothetical protein RSD14_05355 [Clostridia bacterium]
MQVIVISESLIIRKGIVQILSEENCVSEVKESHLYTDIHKGNYDLIIVDLEHVKANSSAKIMVLDFYEDRGLFTKCMKAGIDGYILANIDSEDIGYAVKQLSKGKKYYDADLIENYISKGEVEHTVKKHTSNIFAKLNLKDRMQAAIYAYGKGIVTL